MELVMLQINQKDICMTIFDGLVNILSGRNIKYNKEYTLVTVTSSKTIEKPDLLERVKSILEKRYCRIYCPMWSRPNRFLAIRNERCADIEIREKSVRGKIEYNIYIYIPPTSIKYEWWYDKFMDSI